MKYWDGADLNMVILFQIIKFIKMRDSYIDIAKGISMLLVVRIHTEAANDMHLLYPVIAVPFFFFVSGFFDKSERPFGEWLKKNAYSLLLPAFIWSLLTWLYVSFLSVVKNGNLSEVTFNINVFPPFIGSGVTWFLVALFMAKVLVGFFERLFPTRLKNRQLIMYVVVLLICWALIGIDLPLMLDEGLSSLPFYLLGKILYPHIKGLCQNKILVIVSLGISFAMLLKIFPHAVITYNSEYYGIFLYPLFCFVIICSFLPFLSFCLKISHYTWLSNYGKNTLGVLVIHPILLHTSAVILNRFLERDSNIWFLCFFFAYIFTVLISYYATKLINMRCPILLGR